VNPIVDNSCHNCVTYEVLVDGRVDFLVP
jgi:hypothetical protein